MAEMARFSWLTSLLLSSNKSDIGILVEYANETVVIPAHSLVLCAHSDVFSAMLESDKFQEGRTGKISLRGYSPRSVEYFLRYMYTKSLPQIISTEHILELLKAAHQYDIQDLLKECSTKLAKSLTVETVCEVLESASLLDLETLISECSAYINKNRVEIEKHNLFFVLPCDSLFVTSSPMNTARLRGRKWYSIVSGGNEQLSITNTGNEKIAEGSPEWLSQLLLDRTTSDMEIAIEGSPDGPTFPAHSFVLVYQSPVFLSSWKKRTNKEKKNCEKCKIIFPITTTAREVEYFLRFLYTQQLPSQIYEKNLFTLLRLSHQYQVRSLNTICSQLLAKRSNIHNCCQILELAKKCDIKQLEDASMLKILESWDKILENHLHLVLGEEYLKDILTEVTSTSLENSKTTELIKDWAKWRCCVQHLGTNSFPSLVDPILAEALKTTIVEKSQEQPTVLSDFTCAVVPWQFDYSVNVDQVSSRGGATLFTISTLKPVLCLGFKFFLMSRNNMSVLGHFTIMKDQTNVTFSLENVKKVACPGTSNNYHYSAGQTASLHEVDLVFQTAFMVLKETTFKILEQPNWHFYLANFKNKRSQDLFSVKIDKDVVFKNVHSCVDNVILKHNING